MSNFCEFNIGSANNFCFKPTNNDNNYCREHSKGNKQSPVRFIESKNSEVEKNLEQFEKNENSKTANPDKASTKVQDPTKKENSDTSDLNDPIVFKIRQMMTYAKYYIKSKNLGNTSKMVMLKSHKLKLQKQFRKWFAYFPIFKNRNDWLKYLDESFNRAKSQHSSIFREILVIILLNIYYFYENADEYFNYFGNGISIEDHLDSNKKIKDSSPYKISKKLLAELTIKEISDE